MLAVLLYYFQIFLERYLMRRQLLELVREVSGGMAAA
jgi:hypothetical protein